MAYDQFESRIRIHSDTTRAPFGETRPGTPHQKASASI